MPRVRTAEGELRDEVRQPLFDGISQAIAESPIATRSFFSNVQGKAKYLTNLRQNNLLESTVSYRVMGINLDAQNFEEAQRKVLPLVMERSYFELVVGEKIYWQGNGLYLTGRLHQFSAVAQSNPASAATERTYQRFGDLAVQGIALTGKHVIDIPPLQSFRMNWVIDTMTAGEIASATPGVQAILYMLSLKGLLRRPVQ